MAPGLESLEVWAMCLMAAVNSGCIVPPSSMERGRIWRLLAMDIESQFRCFSREPWLAAYPFWLAALEGSLQATQVLVSKATE